MGCGGGQLDEGGSGHLGVEKLETSWRDSFKKLSCEVYIDGEVGDGGGIHLGETFTLFSLSFTFGWEALQNDYILRVRKRV